MIFHLVSMAHCTLALGIGMLVGIEREGQKSRSEAAVAAG